MSSAEAGAATAAPLLSPKARVRQIWIKVHRWLGLGTLLVMALLGITGSLLVWPETFDSWVNPARHPATSTAAFVLDDAFAASARAKLPDGDTISGIAIPESRGAVMVGGQVNGPPPMGLGPPSRTRLWFDPVTRAHVDTAERAGGFIFFLHAAHGHLLLKGIGRDAVTISGLLLLISSISGLYLLWPGLRRIKLMFRWHRHLGLWMNLHRQTGVWMALVLIIEAVTGAWIATPKYFSWMVEDEAQTARAENEGPPPSRSRPAPKLDLAVIQSIAAAKLPGGTKLDTVYYPTMTNPEWKLLYRGGSEVRINDDTREARQIVAPPPGRAERVEQVMIDLHFGHYGIVWKIIVFLSGLALTGLSLSGIWLWYVARALRNRRKAKRAAV